MTCTYGTIDIVILDGLIYAQDYNVKTEGVIPPRVSKFVHADWLRIFPTMHDFTLWLWEIDAVVDKCRILTETLSDEERQP